MARNDHDNGSLKWVDLFLEIMANIDPSCKWQCCSILFPKHWKDLAVNRGFHISVNSNRGFLEGHSAYTRIQGPERFPRSAHVFSTTVDSPGDFLDRFTEKTFCFRHVQHFQPWHVQRLPSQDEQYLQSPRGL